MHFTARTSNILHILSPTELLGMSNLGKEIASRRKQLNISQADLAEMSGVSLRTVNAIENGKANPSIDVLSKVLEPLGLVITLQERVPTTSNSKYRIRKARVLKNGKTAGYLLANKRKFVFLYDRDYLAGGGTSIAIAFPKSKKIFSSRHLFPFFSGLLPEGESKASICKKLKINSRNEFEMLQVLAQYETIGDITVQGIE